MKKIYFLTFFIFFFLSSFFNSSAQDSKPVIEGFEPGSVTAGTKNQDVIINGKNFSDIVKTISFQKTGIKVNSGGILSSEQIKVNITIAAKTKPGIVKVVLKLSDGSKVVSKKFLVNGKSPFSVKIKNNETILSWKNHGFLFSRISFVQGDKKVVKTIKKKSSLKLSKELVYNSEADTFESDYTQFKDFTAGEDVQIKLSLSSKKKSGYKDFGSATLKALVHRFDTMENDKISLTSPFPDHVKTGEAISISGNALVDFRADIAIKLPGKLVGVGRLKTTSGTIDNNGVLGSKLVSGSDFSFSFTPQEDGVYIIELNNYDGMAVINRPVYVGNGIPVVPLENYFPKFEGSFDLDAFRQEWLALINEERSSAGFNSVVLDQILNTAAQAHTDDMKSNNYFSHIDLKGGTPQDRAVTAGVPTGAVVVENLSHDNNSMMGMEVGLQESPSHESNILSSQWSRVGLGITLNDDGTLLGAQEFGVYPGDLPLPVDTFKDNGIVLDNPLPTSYSKNETVTITGTVTKTGNKAVIFFADAADSSKKIIFSGNISDNKFTISVTFNMEQVGNYNVGMVIDEGTSVVYHVIVK